MALLIGNAGILASFSWLLTFELERWGLLAAFLISLILFNGTMIVRRRGLGSAELRAGEVVELSRGPAPLRVRRMVAAILAALGVTLIVVGGILPARRAQAQRDTNREFVVTIAGLAFCFAGGRLVRTKTR